MKLCKKCGQEKPEHLFYKNGQGYLCSPCKDCVNKVKRKPRKRTEAAITAEKRYREKKRILAEIAAMPVRTIDDA